MVEERSKNTRVLPRFSDSCTTYFLPNRHVHLLCGLGFRVPIRLGTDLVQKRKNPRRRSSWYSFHKQQATAFTNSICNRTQSMQMRSLDPRPPLRPYCSRISHNIRSTNELLKYSQPRDQDYVPAFTRLPNLCIPLSLSSVHWEDSVPLECLRQNIARSRLVPFELVRRLGLNITRLTCDRTGQNSWTVR